MNLETLEGMIQKKAAVGVYFSAPTCNVCHALKPKLFEALESNFPQMEIVSIDVSLEQEIAANFNVFAIPTLLVFLDGREFLRKTRHMSVEEVVRQIQRPYEIMFS